MGYELRARAIALHQNISNLLAHPPVRGTGERVSGTRDPRRLPASETILEISRWYSYIADAVVSGNLALSDLARTSVPTTIEVEVAHEDGTFGFEERERLLPIPEHERHLALVLLARREVKDSVFPHGTAPDVQRLILRIEALSDLGDESDKYVDAILRDVERRVEEWVRGGHPKEDDDARS
ncbi:hypothetical protein [Microbacterium sp. GXF6406]